MHFNKNKNDSKYLKVLILVAIITFIGRLILSPFGNHWDVLVNTGWSKWMGLNGFAGFYENINWFYVGPSQFPLINIIYAGNNTLFNCLSIFLQKLPFSNATSWFNALYLNTPHKIGEILVMKFIPIITDVVIALLIFYCGKKYSSSKYGMVGGVLYLTLPFSFYISSLWGQYDQLSTLFLIISFIVFYLDKPRFLKNKNIQFTISAALYFFAFEVKPTVIFTFPLYLFLLYKNKTSWKNIWTAIVGVVILILCTTKPFSGGVNPFVYLFRDIFPVVLNSDRYFTSTHAFNFWGLISPVEVSSWYNRILGVRYVSFGELIVLILNALSIFIVNKNRDLKHTLFSLYIVTAGGYIFATGMVERYIFASVVVLLILSVLFQRTIYLWILSALIFSLNLYLSWGYPGNPGFPEYFWRNHIMVQTFSAIQIIIYFSVIYLFLKTHSTTKE